METEGVTRELIANHCIIRDSIHAQVINLFTLPNYSGVTTAGHSVWEDLDGRNIRGWLEQGSWHMVL